MNTKVTDVVCGMQIEPGKAAAQSTYKGVNYYFCSLDCKNAFDKEPEKFINRQTQPAHGHK